MLLWTYTTGRVHLLLLCSQRKFPSVRSSRSLPLGMFVGSFGCAAGVILLRHGSRNARNTLTLDNQSRHRPISHLLSSRFATRFLHQSQSPSHPSQRRMTVRGRHTSTLSCTVPGTGDGSCFHSLLMIRYESSDVSTIIGIRGFLFSIAMQRSVPRHERLLALKFLNIASSSKTKRAHHSVVCL